VISIDYFMDKCTEWEINDIVDNLPYMDRNLWEGLRLNAYITAQVNSRKKLTPQDIAKFKWEQEDQQVEEHITEISNEEIKRLKNLSKQWEG